jgi:hypothetical protein
MASATFQLRAADETAQAFASVQNNLQRLKNTSNEAGRALTKNLDVKDAMRSLAMAVGLSADKIANKIAEFVTGQTDEVVKMQEELVKAGDEATASAAALAKARNTDTQNLAILIREEQRLSQIIKQKPADLAAQVAVQKAVNSLNLTQIELVKAQRAEIDKLIAANQEANKQRKERMDVERELDVTLGFQADKEKLLNQLWDARGVYLKQIGQLNGEDLATVSQRNAAERNYIDITKQIIPLEQERRKLAMDAGQAIAQGFEDAIISGNNLREVLKGLAQDLIRLVFRQQITQPLASAVGSIFAGFRAEGGPVGAGSAYMVGEKGPELFVPGSSGSIVPNGAMGGGGGKGGSSVNITYNIASGVSRSDLVPILDQERKRLKAEIPDMVRRGGSYRAAFA